MSKLCINNDLYIPIAIILLYIIYTIYQKKIEKFLKRYCKVERFGTADGTADGTTNYYIWAIIGWATVAFLIVVIGIALAMWIIDEAKNKKIRTDLESCIGTTDKTKLACITNKLNSLYGNKNVSRDVFKRDIQRRALNGPWTSHVQEAIRHWPVTGPVTVPVPKVII